ncbi:DUF6056 family protein [Streptomyces sp. NY05-11A]|uniref:DUF6056 family protein n=1 Tax=Streptomyces soliscabiei TaxID=588897 RepID=UPI0029A86B3B|nr:DUF6056 family protein [Streptomyces sp. NY05-11A]MDX2678614.1 DUF6056 family protein [Streptomyces sp. NY05-11A]
MERLPGRTVRDQRVRVALNTDILAKRGRWWRVLLCAMPLALLAYAAWTARWVRPGGDDWCFLPVVRDGGLSALVDKFYFRDNGRVINAVLVWTYARFDVAGQQWFGAASGVLALLLLWAFCAAALRATERRLPRGTALFMAATVTAVFLFGSLNTYKTFYWPAASVSHTLPPVFACAAVVPVMRAASLRGRAFALCTAGTTGAALGMLSEETTVVALVALGCTVVISGRAIPAARRRFVRLWCAVATAGLVIGTLILYTSPGALHRRQAKNASIMLAPTSLWESGRGFVYITLRCLTGWPYLGAFAGGLILGCLLVRVSPERVTRANNEAMLVRSCIVVLLVAGYACTVIAYPAFRTGVMTSTRLWNDYLLLYVLFLVYAGVLAARAWHRRGRHVATALAAGTAVYCVVCLALVASLAVLDSDMAARARAWDQQDTRMRSQAAAGAPVLPYRRLPIRKMTEPFGQSRHNAWLALCIAHYYRVENITDATAKP